MIQSDARALDGILVVSLEQAVAAPLCTQRLADAGARVIKIERAEGDCARDYDHVVLGESAHFVWLNRGKESLVLDIKKPEDAALLESIVAAADVFVQNLAPGAAQRAGFGSAELRDRHSGLITCDISGYSNGGLNQYAKAYDLMIQCEVGFAAISGKPGEPARAGVSVADICCGLNAHGAILQALFQRSRSKRGCGVAISLFDGLAEWMTVPLLHYDYTGKVPTGGALSHPTIAPYSAFACSDGRKIVISVQSDREWQAFCGVLLDMPSLSEDSRFSTNSSRIVHRGALDSIVAEFFSEITWSDAADRLTAARIAFSAVNELSDFSKHHQLRKVRVTSPSGEIEIPASPIRWAAGDTACGNVPAKNSHGAAIRQEFS